MSLIELTGQTTVLRVARIAEYGYFLTDGYDDVLLHISETEQVYEIDEEVEVFLYPDSHGRLSASAKKPPISIGQYGWVKVKEAAPGIGVFLDVGTKKDILLGEDDLPVHRNVWPDSGDMLYVTLKVDKNFLLYAKLATDPVIQSISTKADRSVFNKNVQGHIYRTAKVGSWIYTIEGYKGFIHESQRPKEPRLGERVEGRVIDVKEDGTVNVSLLERKEAVLDQDAERIYDYLLSRNGAMPYSDKSMPEDIQERFKLSKAAFKRAMGKLMKDGRVYQEGSWTYKKE
ncbi:S1-like domain-containing RNA-binding protein [Neobacillus sp. PS3-34]|uniref:CvfB family protein n=1 Tax=Neobacillus sp. PS3-34 TaxID=3070678 RepID=UPI0027DECB9D|nr:S1-like domain-containing RNA-binding protein [Neobacillus sp. PS3-34]WML49596.1 S1-like domain-containing RNA-binding protein [Neobacillus sp. PS3-34]